MGYYPESRVELSGFVARHYDTLLDVVTLGRYGSFIKRAIRAMRIQPQDRVLDLGAGTGRNACLMMEYLSPEGEVVGLDISDEMIAQFRKNCARFPNARVINMRIDQPLPFHEEFDKAFISFVLHGFPQEAREVIIRNALESLKSGGSFFILDYSEFDPETMPFYLRIPFKLVECPYAFDFIKRDWKTILAEYGFGDFEETFFFKYGRLLKATKKV
ncbi:MAG: class I SAM-dependent methyltransferase [Anaerolineae bacterium]|nr:class I SAM-dependent methyltransferase [Anaerolineae bacterium]